jgi:lipid A ethanolaminephosphotransferase
LTESAAAGQRVAGRHPFWLIGWAALWMASVGNVALWRELAQLHLLDGWGGLALGAGIGVLLVALLAALLGLLAWRTTLKPALTLLLVGSALGTHFMFTYHVVLDTTMVTNVLQTNPGEARDLMGLRFFATVLLLGLLPAAWVWRSPVRPLRWTRRAAQNVALVLGALALAAAVVLALFQPFSSAMRNHRHVRHLANPLNMVHALGRLAARPLQRDESVLLALGEDAQQGPTYAMQARPPLLVLVVGETARSANLGVNGYERPTTPLIAAQNVVSFRNAWACGTSTAASLPCMFSHLGQGGFESRSTNFENLLDVLQHAGLAVLWLDNQSGCKGVCARVTAQTAVVPGDPLCADGECFDEIMLRGLDQRIAALAPQQRARGVVLVMHPMGSHGPAYHKRSPVAFKPFMPECASNVLSDCSAQELLNAYDNTIAYTDHFLASTIAWLKARDGTSDTALVYVSDHGESLGENNLYLHGLPYTIAPDVQKHVPWITWLSNGFERRSGTTMACLREHADVRVTHDNLFHSILGLMDVRTSAYRRELDMHSVCSVP